MANVVVGIGASAGGLDSFRKLLSMLPDSAPYAIILVQHLTPTEKSILAEILVPYTHLEIVKATHGLKILSSKIYVIQSGDVLTVKDRSIVVGKVAGSSLAHEEINILFRSLATEYGKNAVGIVLSGAGSDGTAGLLAIKNAGGLTIAEQPGSAKVDSMPQNAVNHDAAELVMTPEEIPEALSTFCLANQGILADLCSDTRQDIFKTDPKVLSELASILRATSDFDIQNYKLPTVSRRVSRRMNLQGCKSVEEYLLILKGNEREQQDLIRDLFINVTEFFRNPEAFETLNDLVVGPLLKETVSGTKLRIWIPGCATGEEAYSIAMLFLEAIEKNAKNVSLQLFATDIDEEALNIARSAVYDKAAAARIPSHLLTKYFVSENDDTVRVAPRLRDSLSFACHDLCKDPPFSRMNLVSCRNVLIYLEPKTQHHILNLMHFSLVPNGFLFLGTSETVHSRRSLFRTVSKTWHIYQRAEAPRNEISRLWKSERSTLESFLPPLPPRRKSEKATDNFGNAVSALLRARVAPSIVVNQDNHIIYSHGNLTPYFRFPEGDRPQFDLHSVIRSDLLTRVRALLYKCRKDNQEVWEYSSPDTSTTAQIKIRVSPAPDIEDAAVVSFEEVKSAEMVTANNKGTHLPSSDHEALIDQLERELRSTREDLNNTVEELEASNEELRVAHEESITINEELQSTNEELESSGEELRSLNEELSTVNSQLKEKIEQLENTNDDLSNFFSSTKLATVFLDNNLRIKNFTPSCEDLLGFSEHDIGRSLYDQETELFQHDVIKDAREVLNTLAARSQEIRTSEGRWFDRRTLPYRTKAQKIKGLVISFVDVTTIKQSAEKLQIRERQQAVIARLGLQTSENWSTEEFFFQVVREVQSTLDTDFCEILELDASKTNLTLKAGAGWNEGTTDRTALSPALDSPAGYTLSVIQPVIFDDLGKDKRFTNPKKLRQYGVISGITCAIQVDGNSYGTLGAYTKNPRKFSAEDADFLQSVSHLLGNAISRFRAHRRLDIERRVSAILSESKTLGETLDVLSRCFLDTLGVDICEIWLPDETEQRIVCESFLTRHKIASNNESEHRFHNMSFKKGEGFVGRVWRSGTTIWTSGLKGDENFARTNGAKKMDLDFGIAFPIRSAGEIKGVMTLFSRKMLPSEPLLLRSLEAIGISFGDFMRRIEAEKEMRDWEERFRFANSTASASAFETDLEAKHLLKISGAERIFGEQPVVPISMDWWLEKINPSDRNRVESLIRETTQGNLKSWKFDYKVMRGGRPEIHVEEHGQIVGEHNDRRIGMLFDVTHRKRVERELRLADQQKNRFLAMLSHELRNPLAAIQAAAALTKAERESPEKFNETQAVLQRQINHMKRLVDDLLDVSRIVSGKVSLEKTTLDLSQLVDTLLQDREPILSAKKIRLNYDRGDESIWVNGDPARLTQVFDNLISNALKYSKDGGSLVILVKRRNDVVNIYVKDSGIGIDQEMLEDIFEPFRQGDQGLDRDIGGLGLGLALAKGIVELHQGSIKAESDGLDKGATFTVTLPILETVAKLDTKPTSLPVSLGPLKFLIIEDNRDLATLTERLLLREGFNTKILYSGENAAHEAKLWLPNVILCDIGLPGNTSGYDVAAALRKEGVLDKIILLALSGYGRAEDLIKAQEAGFDGHLTKPASIDAIKDIVRKLLLKKTKARM